MQVWTIIQNNDDSTAYDLKYYNEMDDSKLIELKDKKCIGAQIVYGQRYPNKADKKA